MDTSAVFLLKDAFALANSYAEWSTLTVVVGLIIEFAVLLIFAKEISRTEKMLLIFANVLVAGGVGGEYIFGGRATTAAIQLQQASDEKVAALATETAKTTENAAKANENAAKANERAATLEKEAAALKLQLAERTQPLVARRLRPEQIATLVQQLRGSGLAVSVMAPGDEEINTFAGDFIEAFRSAGVLAGAVRGGAIGIAGGSAVADGVNISGPDSPEKTRLEAAFTAAQIPYGTQAVRLPRGIIVGGVGAESLTVMIGPRPNLQK